MNKYRELFEKYVAEVGRAPHALTRIWVLGFCDWLARNESGLTPRALDVLPCGHTLEHEHMLIETGEFVCDQCGAIHQ